MDYIENTLKRANIQSLREYLLYGVEDSNYTSKSYEVRIKEAYDRLINLIKEYDKEGENSKLYLVISNVIDEYEKVYMELGMQAGFRLARDIQKSGVDERNYKKYKGMYSSLFQNVTRVIEELQKAQQDAEEIYISFQAES